MMLRMCSPRWAWLRTLLYVLVTAAIAWWWTEVTTPPTNEVDPADDLLPVREFGLLFILGAGFVTALVSEVLVTRRYRRSQDAPQTPTEPI
jgi:H+/Cl- antiporter ClcA